MNTGQAVDEPNTSLRNAAPGCSNSVMAGSPRRSALEFSGLAPPVFRFEAAAERCLELVLLAGSPSRVRGRGHLALPEDFSGRLVAIGDAVDRGHGFSPSETWQVLLLDLLLLGAFERRLVLRRNPSDHAEDRKLDASA